MIYADITASRFFWRICGISTDGGGSVFVSHGVMISAALLSCSNVRLRNLSFTAEEPMRMEAEVVGYSGKDWILRVTNDAGYYIRDGMLRFTDAYGHDDPYHYTMIVRRGEGTDYIPETKESFDKNVRFYQMEGKRSGYRIPSFPLKRECA